MQDLIFIKTLIIGASVAAASGLLGSFALLRRMALVSDALSHVALPGIALGFLFNFNIFFGALIFLIFGAFIIWTVEHKTKLPVETLVGVLFTVSLAVGALFTPHDEILEALFGNIQTVKAFDFWLAIIVSFLIICLLLYFSRKFVITLISPDLASSIGINPHKLELLFLLIFSLTVAIGIKLIGTLLMGSLIIIPAATARNIAGSMNLYLLTSVMIGVIGALFGILTSFLYGFSPGPAIVFFNAALFFISVFVKK